jgi:hypothetical protein
MTEPTGERTVGTAGFRAIQRLLAAAVPGANLPAQSDMTLERLGTGSEPPRIATGRLLEGSRLRAHRIEGTIAPGFTAFLDGTQQSRTVYYDRGMPVVVGTVAAVVRRRVNRRLVTWRRPAVAARIYAPLAYLSDAVRTALEHGPMVIEDTTRPDSEGKLPIRHPLTLLERAVFLVQHDREKAERELAEEWCREESTPLFVDGGISGSEMLAASPCIVGVVKSHNTLYVDGADLEQVLALQRAERSSVLKLMPSRRSPVATWYLRLRDPAGHDPLWGLVRVEARADLELPTAADEISRWILAESAPIAMPDGRWDRMVYGVRDAEEFLRAIV